VRVSSHLPGGRALGVMSVCESCDVPIALTRFNFPVSIMCRPNLLGVRSKIRLPGLDAELCLPVETKRAVGLGAPFAAPRLRGDKWFCKVVEHAEPEWYRLQGWGAFHSGGPSPDDWVGHLTGGVLRVAVPKATEGQVLKAADLVHESIANWHESLRDWIEVLTHQDLDDRHPEERAHGLAAVETHAWTFRSEETRKRASVLFNPTMHLREASGEPLERAQWRIAVRRANAQVPPPDSHILLRDARGAARRGATRRCVLDAATSVEITLTPLLHRQVSASLGSSVADELLPQRQLISAKLPVLVALGLALPSSLYTDVFVVRNKVIHGGYVPSGAEAQAALSAATMVVSSHSPLA